MTNGVSEQREEYKNLLSYQQSNRAAVSGQRAIRAGRTKYLMPLASMLCIQYYDDKLDRNITSYTTNLVGNGLNAYNKYLDHAYFLGASGRTVTGLSGLIKSKPTICMLEPQVEYLKLNVDGAGRTLEDFTSEMVSDAFPSIWSGVLVARPPTPAGMSQLGVEKANLRPKLLYYNFESIINWDYEVINNVKTLSLLVLLETTTKRTGFKVETELQYRSLELIDGVYHQALYDKDKQIVPGNESAPVVMNGNTSPTIPFYWLQAGEGTKSVMDDLIDANFQHYNIFADYGSKLHYSSFVIYTESSSSPDDANLVVGNGVKWKAGVDATFGILEPNGDADPHAKALDRMENNMAALGADMLKPRISGAESAEAKSLDQVAQNSTTASVANAVSSVLMRAIDFASVWMGGKEGSIYKLNTDYNPTGMNPQLLTAMMAAEQSDVISRETLYEQMQRGEVATSRTFEDEQELIINKTRNID